MRYIAFSKFENKDVEDESEIMARLESELAGNMSDDPLPGKPEEENKKSKKDKKEKKKKKSNKDTAENGDEVDSGSKSDANEGQGYCFDFILIC